MNVTNCFQLPATLVVLGAILLSSGAAAQQQSKEASQAAAIEELRAELEALRTEYQQRLQDLERRIADLETGSDREASADASIADLRAAAIEAAGTEAIAPQPEDSTPPVGRERNLNRFNPEISATGIFLASSGDEREEFNLQSSEIDIRSALDPYSRTRWVIGIGEEGVEVEEGYVVYSSLPGGLELMAGRFKQRFGVLNRQHLHALPQTEYPLVHRTVFGEEGLAQTGLSFTWLLPRPWATANEITVEITNSENDETFSGEDFDDVAALLKVKNFWELGSATYLEWGLSGITGETVWGGDSRVYGTDLTYNWQPPSRAKYREITWRTEFLLSQRDDPFGVEQEAWGAYSYLEGLLRRNLYGGVRYDIAEDPLAPDERLWGIVPYLSWWQSEYVRLRAEYSYVENDATGESEDRFALQLVWAAGPHKHDTY